MTSQCGHRKATCTYENRDLDSILNKHLNCLLMTSCTEEKHS